MRARPVFADNAEKPRVLVCAFAEVPGPSAVGVRAEQILLAISTGLDVDALSLKGTALTHIQRVGASRMMRVPVAAVVDGSPARQAFVERLGAYRRALLRQLDNDPYDVVICLDLFSAATAVTAIGAAQLVIEVADIPSHAFANRYPVRADDLDTRKQWELGERAALKAATAIITPSRAAARILADRVDPRLVRALPRMVDTRIFQPPTVEVALDDVRTVAFVGGREGGPRAALVLAAMQSLAARHPEARAQWIGHPDRASRATTAALHQRGLTDIVTVVDAKTPWELQLVVCAADVVVVAGDVDAAGVPHRALEAMACGRAVVIASNEPACRDHITADQHAVVVAADHAEGVIDAVGALLDDDGLRARLGAAARKQVQRFDLGTRGDELASTLSEATGVRFTCALPPLDEVTAPAPVARAIPVSSPLKTQPPKPTTITPDAFGDVTEDAMMRPMPSPPSSSSSSSSSVQLTARALSSAEADGSRDIWAADTLFDPDPVRPSSSELPAQVKGAMLNTQSGTVPRPSVTTASLSPARTTVDLPRPRTTGPRSARSLSIADGLDSDDEWSRDTIADASPVAEPTRLPSHERASLTAAPRSLLVEQNNSDMTAEDIKLPGTSKSS